MAVRSDANEATPLPCPLNASLLAMVELPDDGGGSFVEEPSTRFGLIAGNGRVGNQNGCRRGCMGSLGSRRRRFHQDRQRCQIPSLPQCRAYQTALAVRHHPLVPCYSGFHFVVW